MTYDDHLYCDTCDKHSIECWCINSCDARLSPEEQRAEFPPHGLCREHDPIWGGPRGN